MVFESYRQQIRQQPRTTLTVAILWFASGLIWVSLGLANYKSTHWLQLVTGALYLGLGIYHLNRVRLQRRLDAQADFFPPTDNRQS